MPACGAIRHRHEQGDRHDRPLLRLPPGARAAARARARRAKRRAERRAEYPLSLPRGGLEAQGGLALFLSKIANCVRMGFYPYAIGDPRGRVAVRASSGTTARCMVLRRSLLT